MQNPSELTEQQVQKRRRLFELLHGAGIDPALIVKEFDFFCALYGVPPMNDQVCRENEGIRAQAQTQCRLDMTGALNCDELRAALESPDF